MKKNHYKHGFSYDERYNSYLGMFRRFYDSNFKDYPQYGGRGIKVSEDWKNINNFMRDLGPKPSKKHSLDRKDVNGNYSKENCRWATSKEQSQNTRRNIKIKIGGEYRTLSYWANVYGFDPELMRIRIPRITEFPVTWDIKGRKITLEDILDLKNYQKNNPPRKKESEHVEKYGRSQIIENPNSIISTSLVFKNYLNFCNNKKIKPLSKYFFMRTIYKIFPDNPRIKISKNGKIVKAIGGLGIRL